MGTSQILKHTSVLRTNVRENSTAEVITFTREQDDLSDLPDVYMLERGDWEGLGRPREITVTVEPGDLLNG